MTATLEQQTPSPTSILVAVAVPPAALGVVVTAVLVVLLGVVGLVVGLVLTAAAVALVVARTGRGIEERVLRQLRARPTDPVTHARLHNLVEGLAVNAGVPEPSLHVVDDEACNALVIGRDPKSSSLVVTSGLLDALDRVPLEGVVARALAQIRSGELPTATLAVAALGGPLAAIEHGGAAAVLARPFGPAARRSLARIAPDDHDIVLDRAGVALTRYPPGLVQALEALGTGSTAVARPVRAATHLWLADPGDAPSGGGLFPPRAPLALRIEALHLL